MRKDTLQVYKFTLRQMVKNRSNRIVFGILILIAALAIPVCGIFFGGDGGAISAEVSVSTVAEYLSADEVSFDTRYGVQYTYSIIALIICVFSVTYIVRTIVEEKASKLVETLMVSIRPLALVLGKILAVMTYMFAQLLLIAAVAAASYFISGQFMDVAFIGEKLAELGISMEVLRMGPDMICAVLVSLALAYLFFSLIAGLSGAGCSNMDEIESANLAAMGAILFGYIAAAAALGASGTPLTAVFAICPFLSAFTAPAYYIFGDIGWGVLLASWAAELLCIAVLLILTARVYDQLILYKGSRLKMTKILAMAGGREGGKRK